MSLKIADLFDTACTGTQKRIEEYNARVIDILAHAIDKNRQTPKLTLAQELVADISDEYMRVYAQLNCEMLLAEFMEKRRAAFQDFIFEREESDRDSDRADAAYESARDEELLGGP